jgi:tetraacyldisaccharide 4'-kinase
VTKCDPFPPEEEQSAVSRRLKRKEVFFSKFDYQLPDSLNPERKYLLVTGIAHVDPLLNRLRSEQINYDHLKYPDHYNFKTADIHQWNQLLHDKEGILTTEKDLERMRPFLSNLRGRLDTVGVKVKFANDSFDKWLRKYTETWKKA